MKIFNINNNLSEKKHYLNVEKNCTKKYFSTFRVTILLTFKYWLYSIIVITSSTGFLGGLVSSDSSGIPKGVIAAR